MDGLNFFILIFFAAVPVSGVLYNMFHNGIDDYFYRNRDDFRKPWFLRRKLLKPGSRKCLPLTHDMVISRLTCAHQYKACRKCGRRKIVSFSWTYEPVDRHWLETGEFSERNPHDVILGRVPANIPTHTL